MQIRTMNKYLLYIVGICNVLSVVCLLIYGFELFILFWLVSQSVLFIVLLSIFIKGIKRHGYLVCRVDKGKRFPEFYLNNLAQARSYKLPGHVVINLSTNTEV